MQTTRFATVISVFAAITACQHQGNPLKALEQCGASELQALVGLPAKEVDLSDHKDELRIIAPDDIITEDYHPERLNVFKDDTGIITKITCG